MSFRRGNVVRRIDDSGRRASAFAIASRRNKRRGRLFIRIIGIMEIPNLGEIRRESWKRNENRRVFVELFPLLLLVN